MKPPDDKQGRPRLVLHLGIVLALKIAVLALLWHQLVIPHRVEVDARAMGQRLAQPSAPSHFTEQTHD